MNLLSFDTETTGIDVHHGAQPFLVTTCNQDGEQEWWEWRVDPKTRKVKYSQQDLEEIKVSIQKADKIILHNSTFDVEMMASLDDWFFYNWPWEKTEDTLLSGHLLASNQPHGLTTMALIYLGVNVEPQEEAINSATQDARRYAKAHYPEWRIAKSGLPEMPSAKTKVWKYDMWLPREIALREDPDNPDNPWNILLREYANCDSAVTLALWQSVYQEMKDRNLLKIYGERKKLLPVVMKMQKRGVHCNRKRMDELHVKFSKQAEEHHTKCIELASSEILTKLPVNGSSNALRHVIFEQFKLESPKLTPKGAPSLDKFVLEHWMATLPEKSVPYKFISNLRSYRKNKTAIGYLESYEKFALRDKPFSKKDRDTLVLHPRFNMTGTHTLRWTSSNPNAQQISKQDGVNLRYAYGPAPGREWYSMDYDNLELRIPAYEANEQVMIDLFENPQNPPYYGSNHLLAFSILHPDKWDHHDPDGLLKAKKKYATTWYQWTKNGNFAVQYGAVESSGTADAAYHVKGGQAAISKNFSKIKLLNERMIEHASEFGYVETISDITVDPERGYPLYCERSKWGKVKPTVPLNFHVQGTACWIIGKAMVSCQNYLDEINKDEPEETRYYIIMQVHDELVFDFPQGKNIRRQQKNIKVKRALKSLMEEEGLNVKIPLTCGLDKHTNNWSQAV